MNKNFLKTGEKWIDLSVTLREECEQFLTDVVKKHGDIDFTDEEVESSIDPIYILYDGGNHPEYNTGYSRVLGVSYKDDTLYVSIDETDEYSVDRIITADLYEIACSVDLIVQ